MRREIVEKRTARSKTFKNDDGTFTCEIGGDIAHHKKNGAWVETDCRVSQKDTDFVPSRHPLDVRIPVNYAQPLKVGDVTIRPLEFAKPPARVEANQNRVLYIQAYDGIDVERFVTPEGIQEALHITSSAGQKVLSWSVTGSCTFAPYYVFEGIHAPVPFTFSKGKLTFDLTQVPVGAVVY